MHIFFPFPANVSLKDLCAARDIAVLALRKLHQLFCSLAGVSSKAMCKGRDPGTFEDRYLIFAAECLLYLIMSVRTQHGNEPFFPRNVSLKDLCAGKGHCGISITKTSSTIFL